MRSPVAAIAIGNPWRSDDGVGWAVARVVRRHLGADVAVIETDGEPGRLLDLWDGLDLAVVTDAVRSGARPGTLHIQPVEIHVTATPRTGSHGLGLSDALALGAALQRLPHRLVVVGVEIRDTGYGRSLSPPVAAAVDRAAAVVAELLEGDLHHEVVRTIPSFRLRQRSPSIPA